MRNALFCPISASGSNVIPRNTQCIPAVKIIAFLELEQNWAFFKGLYQAADAFGAEGAAPGGIEDHLK
ncbi:MAG: hypothetical protein AB1427_20920 [Thermodesulfobacteriota bacterium]